MQDSLTYIERLIQCNRNIEKMIRKEYNQRKKTLLKKIMKANSHIIINY